MIYFLPEFDQIDKQYFYGYPLNRFLKLKREVGHISSYSFKGH